MSILALEWMFDELRSGEIVPFFSPDFIRVFNDIENEVFFLISISMGVTITEIKVKRSKEDLHALYCKDSIDR